MNNSCMINALSDKIVVLQSHVKTLELQRPQSLLIYYGWLNAFNSAQNSWSNEKVAQDLAKYQILVLGDGIQDPSHGDYLNTLAILIRLKELNPYQQIFGYVTTNQSINDFQNKVDMWDALEISGIFMDESGYDYGTYRNDFNTRVDYVHGQDFANRCFVNAWNIDHVLGLDEDVSYPNSTYNPSLVASNLKSSDLYLLESYAVNTQAYSTNNGIEGKAQWYDRAKKAILKRQNYGINLIGSCVIDNDHSEGQTLFTFAYMASIIFGLEGFGSSDNSYGASSAQVKFWTLPDEIIPFWSVLPIVANDLNDPNIFLRYLSVGKIIVDFTNIDYSRIEFY